MFDPIPGRERPHPTRIRFKLTKVCVNRLHLLVYAPVCPALHPPADLLEDPLSGIQLSCMAAGPVQHSVPSRPGDHALHPTPALRVRTSGHCLAATSSSRFHNSLPSERLPPGTGTSTCHLHSLMHLHSTTAPHPADHPPQPHSFSSAKPKAVSELTPAPARAQLKPPFSTTPAHYVCLLMTGPRFGLHPNLSSRP